MRRGNLLVLFRDRHRHRMSQASAIPPAVAPHGGAGLVVLDEEQEAVDCSPLAPPPRHAITQALPRRPSPQLQRTRQWAHCPGWPRPREGITRRVAVVSSAVASTEFRLTGQLVRPAPRHLRHREDPSASPEECSRYFSGILTASRRLTAQRRPEGLILHAGCCVASCQPGAA
jgi:hypothetical protein